MQVSPEVSAAPLPAQKIDEDPDAGEISATRAATTRKARIASRGFIWALGINSGINLRK